MLKALPFASVTTILKVNVPGVVINVGAAASGRENAAALIETVAALLVTLVPKFANFKPVSDPTKLTLLIATDTGPVPPVMICL